MAQIPIVIAGRNPDITKAVRKAVWPDYDVIHIILDPHSGAKDLPSLISGTSLPPSSNPGSQNYTKPPVAVALGGGYDDEAFELIKSACSAKNADGMVVAWLRHDKSGLTEGPPLSDADAFGRWIAERMRGVLDGIKVGEVEGTGWEKEVFMF
ncbi:hypothetical protein BU24DRAFT_494610 [Aaosphaeria arxii CBS 175.79]|uniref:Uncharacterized protein n=1 Tax=Aaosphaeria arxii CBS 175.79 TaxID=1450172 RepID=A0A6A5XIJ5_9PLEO|nr:uncharacterized protein BU24DRAFT_494610 [Aaosphaeria arxii CBS 175.79]KAF2012647.1 hypothetical protein BU24DRAFT_494610 [Aaosphaeria arxii CBS 175.79]